MNKKAQVTFEILTFIVVIIGLIIAAPFVIKVVSSFQVKLVDAVNTSALGSDATTISNVNYVSNTFISWVDKIIIIAFIGQILLLFITAFFIDVHPIFVVFYLIFAFITIVLAPNVYEIGNQIFYGPAGYVGTWVLADAVAQLPMTEFILNNFAIIILALIILSGIIMYAKVKYFPARGGGY
jgi:hypothetical protein